jgi:hypothetical protein
MGSLPTDRHGGRAALAARLQSPTSALVAVGTVGTARVGAAVFALAEPVQDTLTFALPLTVLLLVGVVQRQQRRCRQQLHRTLAVVEENVAALGRDAALRRQVTAAQWAQLCRLRAAVQPPPPAQHGGTEPGSPPPASGDGTTE